MASNFGSSGPFLKCSTLPSTMSQPEQAAGRLVTERVLDLDELSVVGAKPVRVSPVLEEESESDTASEVSELPTDEEEEKCGQRVKALHPEDKEDLSEGELGYAESEKVYTLVKDNREVDSSDKEDASESTNSEDSVREIRVKADVEREDSFNEEFVEDVLPAEENDPTLNEPAPEVDEEECERCSESPSSSSYSSSTSSYASSTPSVSPPPTSPKASLPDNLSDTTVPIQQQQDANIEDVSEVLDTIRDIIPKVCPRNQDRRSIRKASLEDSGFESFQQSSVELEQEEKVESDEDENDVIFMPGGAMELSQRMAAEELRADAVLERAERARAVARACRQESQQVSERKVGFLSEVGLPIAYTLPDTSSFKNNDETTADEDIYSSTLDNDFVIRIVHGMRQHEFHMVDVDDNDDFEVDLMLMLNYPLI